MGSKVLQRGLRILVVRLLMIGRFLVLGIFGLLPRSELLLLPPISFDLLTGVAISVNSMLVEAITVKSVWVNAISIKTVLVVAIFVKFRSAFVTTSSLRRLLLLSLSLLLPLSLLLTVLFLHESLLFSVAFLGKLLLLDSLLFFQFFFLAEGLTPLFLPFTRSQFLLLFSCLRFT